SRSLSSRLRHRENPAASDSYHILSDRMSATVTATTQSGDCTGFRRPRLADPFDIPAIPEGRVVAVRHGDSSSKSYRRILGHATKPCSQDLHRICPLGGQTLFAASRARVDRPYTRVSASSGDAWTS